MIEYPQLTRRRFLACLVASAAAAGATLPTGLRLDGQRIFIGVDSAESDSCFSVMTTWSLGEDGKLKIVETVGTNWIVRPSEPPNGEPVFSKRGVQLGLPSEADPEDYWWWANSLHHDRDLTEHYRDVFERIQDYYGPPPQPAQAAVANVPPRSMVKKEGEPVRMFERLTEPVKSPDPCGSSECTLSKAQMLVVDSLGA